MDFNLTDEQELFVAGVRELMERENWEAYFAECDEKHEYPERWVKELAELGVIPCCCRTSMVAWARGW